MSVPIYIIFYFANKLSTFETLSFNWWVSVTLILCLLDTPMFRGFSLRKDKEVVEDG